jgi:hypothetical protein
VVVEDDKIGAGQLRAVLVRPFRFLARLCHNYFGRDWLASVPSVRLAGIYAPRPPLKDIGTLVLEWP